MQAQFDGWVQEQEKEVNVKFRQMNETMIEELKKKSGNQQVNGQLQSKFEGIVTRVEAVET